MLDRTRALSPGSTELTEAHPLPPEQPYRLLVEQAAEAIIGLDLHGDIRHFNQAALDLLGYSAAEISQVTLADMLDAEGLEEARLRQRRLLRREPVEMPWTLRVRRKNGEMVMLEVTAQVLWYGDQALEFEVIGRDVTERLAFEAEQRRQGAALAALLRVSEVVNQSLDLDRVLHEGLFALSELGLASAAGVFLLDRDGFRLGAQIGWPPDRTPDIQRMPLRAVVGEALRSGRLQVPGHGLAAFDSTVIAPLVADRKQLGVLHLERSGEHPYHEQDIQLLQTIAFQLSSAIAKAQVHQALQETAAQNERLYRQAEEARGYLDLLIRNTPDVLLVCDGDLTFRPLNPQRLALISGYRPEELAGRPFMQLVPPAQHEQLRAHWLAALEGQPQSFEIELLRADGTRVIALASAALIPEYAEVLIILKDVTGQRQLEAQVRQNEKLTALGRLVAGVAHELNNPLAAILGLAQLQLMEELPRGTRSDIESIERAALRIDQIIQQIRTFSRSQPLLIQRFEIAPLVRETLARLAAEFAANAVEVTIDLSPDLPPIAGDLNQIGQALFNLLYNALQALQSIPDVTARRLSVRGGVEGQVVSLVVADSGPGILPEHMVRVFEPFFTTRPVGQGAGLGLSVVHTIVRQHGGRVWVASSPGQGATFHVELPIDPLSADDLPPDR